MSATHLVALLLAAAASIANALEVTPGSHCAVECLDSPGGNDFSAAASTTTTDDITCRDVDYSTTDVGLKFRKCLDCLQGSTKVDRTESDLKWYIYNLRYALGTCLYASPKAAKNGTVAAQCDKDRACKPLKAPLVAPGFDGNPNSPWNYCTEKDGAFMGGNLSPCISCLQATEGEVYLSNFMAALEAGCVQQPADGNIVGLSGSVFTTNAVNMTNPPSKDGGNRSSGTLSASVIAGIAIGVVLIFLLAIVLLIVHFRREKAASNRWQQTRYYDSYSSPGAHSHQNNVMSHAYRRYYTGNAFSGKPAPADSAGEYYDRMEAELKAASGLPVNQRTNHAPPQSHTSSSVTAHDHEGAPGLESRSPSRGRSIGQTTPPRTPSPPAQVRRERRSNTPDSFAIQAYLDAAEESARLATQRSPPTSAEQKDRAGSKRTSVVPSVSAPRASRFRLPKMPNPAKLFSGLGSSRSYRELVISPPVMTHDPRFHDIPMVGPMKMSRDRPPPLVGVNRRDTYVEVPLKSGKSTLYGY